MCYLIAIGLSAPLLVWLEPVHFSDVLYYTAAVWLSLMVLSGLSWGLAMVLWMILLKRLDVSGASVSIYLLPFPGVIISTLTLGGRENYRDDGLGRICNSGGDDPYYFNESPLSLNRHSRNYRPSQAN